ncbi:hypothetical protein Hanom_Chr15g01406971 [Helianthus anomalus]
MSWAMLTVVPYPIAAVKPAATAKQRQVKLSTKSHIKASCSSSNTAGFGAKKKEALWQCVTNCGACCMLDKGPSFPSPEEIFEDSCDIQFVDVVVGDGGGGGGGCGGEGGDVDSGLERERKMRGRDECDNIQRENRDTIFFLFFNYKGILVI